MIMSDEDMDRLIATGDTELLCHIAEHVDDFVACDLDEICEKLFVQKDPPGQKGTGFQFRNPERIPGKSGGR